MIALLLLVYFLSVSAKMMPAFIQRHKSFLKLPYSLKDDTENKIFLARQVPGDGGCLFHSISTWLTFIKTQQHADFEHKSLSLSNKLRSLAVRTLKKNVTLHLEGDDMSYSGDLLEKVAEHYNTTSSTYCNQMMHPKTWGGGPEIVALANHFKCPIHVYKLAHNGSSTMSSDTKDPSQKSIDDPSQPTEFCLKVEAKFGSPTFDNKIPISLLCADGRFPNIKPGEENEGDHFLALFPCDSDNNLLPLDTSSVQIERCPEFQRFNLLHRSKQFVRRRLRRRHPDCVANTFRADPRV